MTSYEPGRQAATTVCYRHPDRVTGVSCQRCERHICSQCMHSAPVGMHCPECVAGSKQKVYTRATLPVQDFLVTKVIIGLNLAVFVAQFVFFDATASSAGSAAREIALNGGAISAGGEWWRIFSSGFGHFGLFHLGMNMYSLFILGQILERRLGSLRFALAYLASLVGGSFGALLLEPRSLTMGASGAIFGLLGLLVMVFRSQGISIAQSGLGPVLVINLVISLSGYVSLGGHAGGFVIGVVLGVLYFGKDAHSPPPLGNDENRHNLATVVLAAALFGACLWAATTWTAPLF